MKLADVNGMNAEAFEAAFGEIAEHSVWVARQAFAEKPFGTREDMVVKFADAVMEADHAAQLALLRAHPDLATKAKLTADSTNEQKGAGLDTLSKAEFQHFTEMNDAYKARNGFPFIFAVKGATKHPILEGFGSRLHNDSKTEFQTALQQVCRIIRFRLEDRVQE